MEQKSVKMKIIKKIAEKVKQQWNAETPKIAKIVRNAAATITVVLPSAWGIVMSMPKMNDMVSNGTTRIVLYTTLISAIITGIAGLQKK